MIAKNMNKINHSANKLTITGRLELEPALVESSRNQRSYVHCRFEQFVQAIRSLNELEGNRHDEQFLQRGEDTLLRPKPDYKCCDQATQTHNGIKDIPPIRAETAPPQPITSDSGIQDDNARNC
jgi:hypothetical protein